MNIDINKPTLTINLADMDVASEICQIMKSLGICDYAYRFKHKDNTLKIGMSADYSVAYGDRIYRQAANIPGWNQSMLGSSGKDMIDVIREYSKDTGLTVSREDCTIEIWDVTKEPQVALGRHKHNAELAESILMDQYEAVHNRLPVGNFKDTRKSSRRGYISIDLFNDLFEVA